MAGKLIAGNWKMNGLRAPGAALAATIAARAQGSRPATAEVLVCPPFTLLQTVGEALQGAPVALGAQDCHHAPDGAYTGDISAAMLRDLGCRYVILGHSERRQHHGETSAEVSAKAKAALAEGLTPIICVGETQDERDAGRALAVIAEQIDDSVPAESPAERLVVAYEPVWAIGTGRSATVGDVAEAHAEIRARLAARFGEAAAGAARILYGGSVKPDNAEALLAVGDVDGALVGGASLKAEDFWAIVESCPWPRRASAIK